MQVNSTTVTSLLLGAGDTLTIETNGSNGFNALAGSAQLAYAAAFASNLASPGYAKLPGGLILQWGTYSLTSSPAAYNFPLTWPNACLALVVSPLSALTAVAANVTSTTQFTAEAATGTPGVFMISLGH